MKATSASTQKMVKQAFALLLQLRERENAHVLLTQAVAFLCLLRQGKDVNHAPVMLSVLEI